MVSDAGKTVEGAVARLRDRVRHHEHSDSIQLPLWSETKRGTPNSFIRSALFAAIQSKDRVFLQETVLASQKGITVKFTGQQLNQEDLTVWETLAHMARERPLGEPCEFTAHALLTALGLHTGLSQHKQLHSTIVRLTACAVEITHENKTYVGSLLHSAIKDELTKHYVVELNRSLTRLFGESQWTALDWEQRQELRGKPLAQALHAFYSSHREPFPVKVQTLRDYVGSKSQRMSSFKFTLRLALDELVRIGFLTSYELPGDVVSVHRAAASLLSR